MKAQLFKSDIVEVQDVDKHEDSMTFDEDAMNFVIGDIEDEVSLKF